MSSEISDNRFMATISASSIRNLLPKSMSIKRKMTSNSSSNSENIPPTTDPNIPVSNLSPIITKSPTKVLNSDKQINVSDVRKEVAPTPDPHVKKEVSVSPDPHVKVVVRIRTANNREGLGDHRVRRISDDSLSVEERKFTFDSVLDSNSKQGDVFELVGVPLVKSALAGYNTSVLACGQTGSGKSYTMWGPPSAMLESNLASSQQGLAPRIFQMLFSDIQREQEISEGNQINYQCRCSFLEIYNEQIGDLLDPTQRNLKIKDDTRNGFYVENLTEEYVASYEDVTQILIKGLSCRKVGATSMNSKSSRSHVVFTCIVESWCKSTSSKCFSSSKTSRITLIDLAGLERTIVDDAGKHCEKEGKYVKKSISQLGHLVNILAESPHHSRKPEVIPYESSCLTHILKESLGGNAKLTVICAISPDNKCSTETVSTLRFGVRAKSIVNYPVMNEITEDDVNGLSDQIRKLKEELISAKSDVCSTDSSKFRSFGGHSARESLNQLRVSLNRSLILPRVENDHEKEIHIDEHDVEELRQQLEKVHDSVEDLTSEHYISFSEESENDENSSGESPTSHSLRNSFVSIDESDSNASRSTISINACRKSHSTVLEDPALTESPKIGNAQRRSVIFSSSHLGSQNDVSDSSKFTSDVLRQSCMGNDRLHSSLRSSKIFSGATESLAASLQRGLQIIDDHQRNSVSVKDSVEFSFEHFALKPCQRTDKASASVQTLAEERQSSNGSVSRFICAACHQRVAGASVDVHSSLNTVLEGRSTELADQMSTDVDRSSVDAIKREELETLCQQQKAEIEQLNLLVEQFKNQKLQNETIGHANTLPLEVLKNEIVPYGELRNEELLKGESRLARKISSENVDTEMIKEAHEQLDHDSATSFDADEKEALLKEIEGLRSKLQSNTDASLRKSTGRLRSSSLLLQSIQLRKSGAYSLGNSEDELEKERQRWMETESDWISLTDDLRIDLETIRQRAEKAEMELRLEKKCTEELDDVVKRSVLGHARMIEHYAELQEKYMDLVGKHRSIMEGIEDVKRAATKAGAKGKSRFAKSLASELSVLRVERDRERDSLRKENRSLKIQLRDTAEAVHAAGELLVRLREAEEAASVAEENFTKVDEENDKLKKQVEKLKRKHKMEMITMKQYLAESRLPESALRPLFREDSDIARDDITSTLDDDQAWRAEFGAIYQDHY